MNELERTEERLGLLLFDLSKLLFKARVSPLELKLICTTLPKRYLRFMEIDEQSEEEEPTCMRNFYTDGEMPEKEN